MTTLQRRLDQLERKISPPALPLADLSQFTTPELQVLKKLTEHTLKVEQQRPTGKRPLQLLVERSLLTAEESLIFDGMSQRGTSYPGYVAVESRQ
jgi:hypothetical protein